jgi:hypothetical protein
MRSRGGMRPSFSIRSPPWETEGAGKTGHRLVPMVRVQKKARGRTTGSAEDTRPSLRNGFTAYTRSPR